MEKQKFRISIIDFMPQRKKFDVGKYRDGSPACLGDVVEYNGENGWFIAYRYGNVVLKKPGMIAMIGLTGFKDGDFSGVEQTNIFGAGVDWLIIGYDDEPMFDRLKPELV
jgi:hypothetical protein